MTAAEDFGQWLRERRQQADWSQEKVAKRLRALGFRITQTQIARVEAASRMALPLDLVVSLTALFGATPDVALGLAAADTEQRLMPCPACEDAPPAGFTCNTCGGAS